MAQFTAAELQAIDDTDELQISSRRRNGTMRPFVTIWGVREGDDLYVRSAHGATNGWFRRAVASGRGEVRIAGAVRRIRFERLIDDATQARIDAAYHAKYDRYGSQIVGSVVGPNVTDVTLRLRPE